MQNILYKKMVKKVNEPKKGKSEKKTIINFFLKKGYSHKRIAKEANIPRSTVVRLVHEIENEEKGIFKEKKLKTKLPKEYYKKIVDMGENKTTYQMPGRCIANALNEEFKKKNILNKEKTKILSISTSQVNKILKKNLITRKVRKTFYLTEEHKKERVRFCKKIISDLILVKGTMNNFSYKQALKFYKKN